MANIGEALTTRLARERLEAIKKFLPVWDSVREKLQAQQQAKVDFMEDTTELFKPVTTATEAVKTAIVGKPGPTDPDKPQQSLFQAIEQMQNPAIALTKAPFYEQFTEEVIRKIKDVPLGTAEDLKKFPKWVLDSYKNRKQFLKPGADKGISRDNWSEYVYKIQQNKPVLYKQNDPLFNHIRAGISGLDLQRQQEREQWQQEQEQQRQLRLEERKKVSKKQNINLRHKKKPINFLLRCNNRNLNENVED